jgi:hypothetical protein
MAASDICVLVKSFTNPHPKEASTKAGLAMRLPPQRPRRPYKGLLSLWGYLTPSLFVPGGL